MNRSTVRLGLFAACPIVLLLANADVASAQSCSQTLSPGANVAGAVASAPQDATICLNSGNYGTVDFSNINRSGFVTVRSTTGRDATINPRIGASRFIRLQSLTISGALINSCSSNIQLLNSTFTGGLLVTARSASCPADMKLLVDGNTFGDLGPATFEGRISVADDDGPQLPMGLTISNNRIGPGCRSDGVQLVGGASGVTIGPGNIFDGIVQSGSVHCDMIQFFGSGQDNRIVGNWFRNGSVALTHHTSTPANTVFRDNVVSNVNQLQVGQSKNFVFEHNTLFRLTDVFTINSNTTNALIRSNVMVDTRLTTADVGFGPCVNCTVSFNMCNGSCSGTNQIIGTPIFVGGSVPTTWEGWRLASSSLGFNGGHDGLSVGIVVQGTSTSPPSPPTNVRIVR